MPKVFIKRGTRAQLDVAAAANQLNAGEPYLITDESRIAVGLSANTYETYAKESEAGGGGGIIHATATITVNTTPRGVYECTVNVVNASVTLASFLDVWLAPMLDTDENSPDMLLVTSIYAVPLSGSFDVTLTFGEPTRGDIKLNYSIGV